MATNRFVLVPEDIYKGFTSTDTGNINLDYSRRMLENVKKEKTNPVIKNARYNQELRRYLHLKKEHEDKPIKVEVTGSSDIEATPISKPKARQTTHTPNIPVSPMIELSKEFLTRINANPEKFQVTSEGRIKNEHNKIIEGSDIKKSINWIIATGKGLKAGPRPKGTLNLENQIRRDDVLVQILENMKKNESFPSPIGQSTPRSSFRPNLWR